MSAQQRYGDTEQVSCFLRASASLLWMEAHAAH
jgi:hypothetical protein